MVSMLIMTFNPLNIALQGGFHEHQVMLQRANPNVQAVQVRTKAELEDPNLDGLVIPGGESTTMAIVAQQSGAWEALQTFVRQRPVWVSWLFVRHRHTVFTGSVYRVHVQA
jgi:hypothetical protein